MGHLRLRNSQTRAARLPNACMVCGSPTKKFVTKSFSWFPPWVFATAVLGVLPAFILTSVLTKRKRVDVPLCRDHRSHFRKRVVLFWVLVAIWMVMPLVIPAVFFGLFAAGAVDERSDGNFCPLIVAVIVLMLVSFSAIMLVSKFTAIRPTEITDDDITLAGLHDDFLDAYEEMRESGRSRRMTND